MANSMRLETLILTNSASPGWRTAYELALPQLEHLGLPGQVIDIMHNPLPEDTDEYALVVIAQPQLDPNGRRLGAHGRARLLAAVQRGSGLVSFDLTLPHGPQAETLVDAGEVVFSSQPHYITDRHEVGSTLKLFGPFKYSTLSAPTGQILLDAGGGGLLMAENVGAGRLVQWASGQWLSSYVLGPLGGLDDLFWRSLVWAARKPFVLRGLPPLMSMRVDDVVGLSTRYGLSPLAWVMTANRFGFKPWLGLFIYNLTSQTVSQLRRLTKDGLASSSPHAFGRHPTECWNDLHYPNPDPVGNTFGDEFIYFDHAGHKPWPDAEAARRLRAVDDWYAANPLPISPYFVAHWYEMGANTAEHVRQKWGCDQMCKVMDVDLSLLDIVDWLPGAPFRCHEPPGKAHHDPTRRSQNPVYYADFVNLVGHRFFNCLTEIRDDAGYEWAPDNDVQASIGRGVRQLRRALDSFALPSLFSHETDFIAHVAPDNWESILAGIRAGIASYNPIQMTTEDAVDYVRATRTSRMCGCRLEGGQLRVHFRGAASRSTHFYLFSTAGETIEQRLVEVPAFENDLSCVVTPGA
jgi:hypothetical protein